MSTVRTILQQKRLPLLNLFVRSALLNYAPDERYGIELIEVDAQRVFHDLVLDELEFGFNITEASEAAEELFGTTGNGSRQLQTPYTSSQLLNRLFYTFHRSIHAQVDYGETVLYLAMGMLRAGAGEQAEGVLHAPLFLVPVTLVREDVHTSIKVKSTGEDPLLNPALRIILSKDHGIDLPQWNTYKDDGILRCMEQVASAVAVKSGWHVYENSAYIDFFDTSTVQKYLDLDPERSVRGNFDHHRILNALLLHGFENEEILKDEGLSTDILVEPGQIRTALDANNEQLMVLYHSMNGVDVAVEGAAGTGKTQTIANLISDALAREKNVLVVSNKGAALNDVWHRLDSAGLSHLALPLYGRHLKRHRILRELNTNLSAVNMTEKKEEVSVETLIRVRNKLNVYANSLHTSIRDSGVSPFEAYNQLAEIAGLTGGIRFPAYNGSKFVQWKQPQFESFMEDVTALQNQFKKIGIAQRHPFWGSRKTVYNAALKPEIQQKCRVAGMALNAVRTSSSELGHQMGARAPSNSDDVIRLVRSASRALEAPDLHGVSVHSERWESSMEHLAVILETGAKMASIQGEFDHIVIPEAWSQDVMAIRQALIAHGSKKTRSLIGEYRKARDRLAGLCRESIPKANAEQLRLLNGILEVQRLQVKLDQHEELARSLFGRQWQGLNSNWDHLDKVSTWLIRLHQDIEGEQISSEILDFLVQFPNLERLRKKAERVAKDFNTFLEASRDAAGEVGMEEALGMSKSSFGRIPFGNLLSLFAHWEKHLDSLQDVVTFNHLVIRLKEKGMEDIVKLAVSWSESAKFLTHCIHAARHKALLTDALKARRSLSSFDSEAHQQTLQQYEELDNQHLLKMRQDVLDTQTERFATQRLPSKVVRALAFELEEAPKRTLSELMADAGQAVQDVKPVFLMTPSSVAWLLERSNVRFDLVIFDEAGRMSVTDALGAISRSSQVVAFGDSMQSAPRSFFEHMATGESRENYTALTNDNLLQAMVQRGAIEHRFTWQLGSYAAPLVKWVSQLVYDDRLLLYPKAYSEDVVKSVRLHDMSNGHHNGNGSPVRSLISELVEACLNHLLRHPQRSACIVTQNVEEVEAVEWELERQRRKNENVDLLFKRNGSLAFSVKTIEQAQGDRFDIVFVGLPLKNIMRFRKSSRHTAVHSDEDVQRQLATLASITRHRCRVYIDASLVELQQWAEKAADISVWNRFIMWLQQGHFSAQEKEGKAAYLDSLKRALEEKGYKTAIQVGLAGYYMDLAVEHPDKKGYYMLGILGDGFQYNDARTVRDRDRLQPAIIEKNGWNIYRLWSIEWFRNPHREIEKICEHLESLLTKSNPSTVASQMSANNHIGTNGSLSSSLENIE